MVKFLSISVCMWTCITDITRLTKIKDVLPDYIEYNHIKIVIALLVRQYGQIVNSEGAIILLDSQSSQDNGQIDLTDSAEVSLIM